MREPYRLRRERATVRAMVAMYCVDHHGGGRALCDECRELSDYADRRLDRCPYGAAKPACTNCPIHCYRPGPREQMREVMRFAGPRMLTRHPWLAILHLLDARKPAPPLRDRAAQPRLHVIDRRVNQSAGAVTASERNHGTD